MVEAFWWALYCNKKIFHTLCLLHIAQPHAVTQEQSVGPCPGNLFIFSPEATSSTQSGKIRAQLEALLNEIFVTLHHLSGSFFHPLDFNGGTNHHPPTPIPQ